MSWSYATDEGLTVALLDPASGRTLRGPLAPGRAVLLEVVLALPDPPARYQALPGPIEVVAGPVGGGQAPAAATVRVGSRRPRARLALRMPQDGQPVRLAVDVHVAGHLVRSLALTGRPADGGGRMVQPGPGELLYRSGGLGAAELDGLEPVSAMVSFHGAPGGDTLTAWTLHGDPPSRTVGCRQVALAEVDRAVERYRRHLDWLAHLWAGGGQPATGGDVVELAWAGADLRRSVLGSVPMLAPGARVALAADPHVAGMATVPWGGLYDGEVAAGAPLCLGGHGPGSRCEPYGRGAACADRFWGLRYELACPAGRGPAGADGPGADRSGAGAQRGGDTRRDGLTTRGEVSPATRSRPGTAGIDRPVRILDVVSPRFRSFDHLPGLAPPAVLDVRQVSTLSDLDQELGRAAAGVDLMVLLAPSCWGDGTQERAGTFALELDRPLGPRLLGRLAERQQLSGGPIVVVSACYAGVMGPNDRHRLVSELRRLGARGVVLTETEIDPRTAARLSAELVTDLLAGHSVPAALLRARRREWGRHRSLARLGCTWFGPPDLQLGTSTPAREVVGFRPDRPARAPRPDRPERSDGHAVAA